MKSQKKIVEMRNLGKLRKSGPDSVLDEIKVQHLVNQKCDPLPKNQKHRIRKVLRLFIMFKYLSPSVRRSLVPTTLNISAIAA